MNLHSHRPITISGGTSQKVQSQNDIFVMEKAELKDIARTLAIVNPITTDDGILNTSCDDQKIPSWSAINSLVTTENIEEQSVGFLHVVPHPVTENVTEYTVVDNFLDILTQLDLTSLIVTSYGTRNQTGTPGQIQGLGNNY